jgi:hypothetical protein
MRNEECGVRNEETCQGMALNADQEKRPTLRSWLIIAIISILFICWGVFIFLAIGDKGSPAWDFGVVKDIPGESIYSTERR